MVRAETERLNHCGQTRTAKNSAHVSKLQVWTVMLLMKFPFVCCANCKLSAADDWSVEFELYALLLLLLAEIDCTKTGEAARNTILTSVMIACSTLAVIKRFLFVWWTNC
jgi:hypothetical protein